MEVNYDFNTIRQGMPPATARLEHGFTGPASQGDYAACRGVMRAASKNYSSASNYLPARLRPHVEALYALMRVGDDRVDVAHGEYASPQAAIDDWERAYEDAFSHGGSPHPVMRAYLDTALRFAIPRETMHPFFRAMRADLTVGRYPRFIDLLEYMQGSAIPVGRAMTHILGVRPGYTLAEALEGADSLSIAMQLTNFWRDIGEDWQRGRIYIPLEDMERFGVTEAHIAGARPETAFVELLEYEFERTQAYYRHARRAVPMLAAGRWAVMSSLEIYRAILPAIRSAGYDVFTRRSGTGRLAKIGIALKCRWQFREGLFSRLIPGER